MILLDPRTVLISYVISSLISMAVMASLWAQHRRRSSGLAYWLVDFIMQFLGLLLIVLRGNLPDFFSIVLSNTLIIGGTLVLLIGLERYYRKSSRQWFNYIYLGLFFFIQVYFVYIQPSLQWRTINISVGILVMGGQCAWLLMHRVDPALQPGARPAVIAFGFFSLVSLVRIFVDLAVPQGTDVFKSGLYDTLVILIYQMLFIGLTYALVLMVHRRLNTALEDDISERKREEQALKGSEIRYRSLFENSPISLWEEDYSEVKRHLEKLKQQEITDLRAYFDSHPDVLIECANEIKVLDTNQATLTLMRASSKDQLIGNLKAVIGLGANTAFVDELTSIADGRTEYHWEGDNYNLDGERISVSLRWMAAPGFEDTLERVLVSVLDVTARKRAEQALHESETSLQAILHSSADGILAVNSENQVLYSNERFMEMWRIPPEVRISKEDEVLLQHVLDQLSDPQGFLQKVRQLYKSEEESIDMLDFKDGRTFERVSHPLMQAGELRGRVWSIRDVTERKQAEQSLRESEKRYQDLFENAPISLWEEDLSIVQSHIQELRRQGIVDFRPFFESHPEAVRELSNEIRVLDVNAATLELMRAANKAQLIGSLKQVIRNDGDGNFLEELVSIAEGQSEFEWDAINHTLEGEELTVSLKYSAVPGYEDSLEKVLISVIDVTAAREAEESIKNLNAELEQRVEKRTRELRDAQQKLLRQEKLAVLGQMAGSVGHELRNPLGVISNSVYYLKQVQPDANEKTKKYLDIIEQQVHTSDKIIGDLLGFARNTSVDRQALAVPKLVQKVLERYPVPGTIRVKLELPAELPRVFVDPPQIEQVLGNLVVNACQAMKEGGDLAISARQITPDTEQDQQQQMLKIEVKDAGTGISSENMQKLFEPLFTTKAGGIGLGLAVSRKLAEANGGRIEVESQAGKGSTFTLYLPVRADK
jgi:PAS domain S-box-containing protein